MPIPPPPPPSLPPPPPPCPPPPPLGVLQSQTEPPIVQYGDSGQSALLADIQKGTRLKKVLQVNDRSAPTLTNPKVNTMDGNSGSGGPTGPTLSGLFAGGFPVLRPVGQRDKGLYSHPVTRSGSTASLKQPLWNMPSQGESFRSSTPDLSPSRRSLERTASLTKTRPISSYTAPPSPSQATSPGFKPLACPPTITPPPPPPHQEHARNKSPLSTCPPPPPQITKPTWLPLQSHSIPMPTMPPPPPPPLIPPVALSDRLSAFFYSQPPSPKLGDVKFSPPPPHPPPFPASFTSSSPASLHPPPLPPPPKVPAGAVYRPTVPLLPPSYPCTAPTRKPPAVPGGPGAGRLAPPPAPPARSTTTELSSRIPPPLPPLPPAPAPALFMRNGHLYSFDDFESKFQFHSVEDFPPPEVFRPFPRIYPSKENRVSSQPPAVRTQLR